MVCGIFFLVMDPFVSTQIVHRLRARLPAGLQRDRPHILRRSQAAHGRDQRAEEGFPGNVKNGLLEERLEQGTVDKLRNTPYFFGC